jgi:hypothetical protein
MNNLELGNPIEAQLYRGETYKRNLYYGEQDLKTCVEMTANSCVSRYRTSEQSINSAPSKCVYSHSIARGRPPIGGGLETGNYTY